jgi:hypothetical protein
MRYSFNYNLCPITQLFLICITHSIGYTKTPSKNLRLTNTYSDNSLPGLFRCALIYQLWRA